MVNLNQHDKKIFNKVASAIRHAIDSSREKPLMARKIHAEATKYRNKGRNAAIRSHPFGGKCEKGGSLERKDAVLHVVSPEKGYEGKVRWLCPKANNSGKRSCGKCK